MKYYDFGKGIQEARQKSNVTADDLAKECGVDPAYIYMIEKGLKKPSLELAFRMASALNCKVDDFGKVIG